ncbi:endonuclease/exonuclease/phosphatase family protein [Streptomyces sp. NPDC056653]|uniref:endonuclease/exonuclease/phosphatase family protein n=1 Tax=Streptomyces sp. NPDC056653 TaxID=3345894 RepID=UPI0036C7B2FC
MARRWATLLVAVGLVAAALGLAAPAQAGTRQLEVATYNIYLGADLAPLALAQTPKELVERAGIAYDQVVATDFPSRARAISRLLRNERPEVIGLQEVALWKKGPLGRPLHTTYDFLDILLRELRRAGLHYRAAAVDTTGTITLPISPTQQVSFTNRDAVLVQDGLPVTNAQSHLFAAKLVVTTPFGVTFTFPRGWSAVDVALKSKSKGKPARVRVATTHLQPGPGAPPPVLAIRNAQAQELHAALAQSPYPVTALGDFNALPIEATGPYRTFTNGGYDDAWQTTHGPGDGFTAIQDPDLRNLPSKLSARIDYVFYQPAHLSADSAHLVGDKVRDRTPTGLWPSDHAGLVVRLRLH